MLGWIVYPLKPIWQLYTKNPLPSFTLLYTYTIIDRPIPFSRISNFLHLIKTGFYWADIICICQVIAHSFPGNLVCVILMECPKCLELYSMYYSCISNTKASTYPHQKMSWKEIFPRTVLFVDYDEVESSGSCWPHLNLKYSWYPSSFLIYLKMDFKFVKYHLNLW